MHGFRSLLLAGFIFIAPFYIGDLIVNYYHLEDRRWLVLGIAFVISWLLHVAWNIRAMRRKVTLIETPVSQPNPKFVMDVDHLPQGESGPGAQASTPETAKQRAPASLEGQLSSQNPSVRIRAARIAAGLEHAAPEIIAALQDVRSDPASEYEERCSALWALCKLGKNAELGFVHIPAGEFILGSEQVANERPAHRLYLDEYFIGRTQVTNARYLEFAEATQCKTQSRNWRKFAIPGREDHPVLGLSWEDAKAYADWLGGVLPSEAEWEKAASWDPVCSVKRILPWGDYFNPDYCNSGESHNFTADGKPVSIWASMKQVVQMPQTTPVGAFSPYGDSAYGVADMAGNAWDWTRSIMADYPYDPSDGREEPVALGFRVVRGGSWFDNNWSTRCSFRFRGMPGDVFIGFRVVVHPCPE